MSGHSKDNESTENDVWDDSLLIQSYDKSVKLAKRALAKKIAQATNKNASSSTTQQNRNESSSTTSNDGDADAENGSQDAGHRPAATAGHEFKVGDYVRATFTDGVDYEAKIVYIDEVVGDCLVKYVGYGNEQIVSMANLVKSWGKKSRRKQFKTVKGTVNDAKDEPGHWMQHGEQPMFGRLPPPPPMPPNLNDEDSEHLSAMLMSWYMSGYYTGFYHGQRKQKAAKRK